MPGAASASVRDLTPDGGVTNSNWSGGCTEKSKGVNPPPPPKGGAEMVSDVETIEACIRFLNDDVCFSGMIQNVNSEINEEIVV